MERDNSFAMVGGILAGAVVMFFLDPRSGSARRAKARTMVDQAFTAAEEGVSHLMGSASTAPALPVPNLTLEERIDDRRVAARVRSTVARLTSMPRAVRAETHRGVVTLTGSVLEDELRDVLTGIRGVRGVFRVESRLLAVPRGRRGQTPKPAKEPQTEPDAGMGGRLAIGATGVAMVVAGTRGRGAVGVAAAAVGGLLIARAITDTPTRLTTMPAGGKGVPVEQSVEIGRSARDVFAFWSNFRNFPQFMRHIREVRETESGISHWVADGPAGFAVSWDAEITALKPHQLIGWKSLDGSRVMNEGEVRFEEIDEQSTRVHVRMTYSPPGGAMGHAVATFFGADPEHQLSDDLRRLKALLEGRRGAVVGVLPGLSTEQ